jgi:eukaryotic-like serine/threonine-protein kinase
MSRSVSGLSPGLEDLLEEFAARLNAGEAPDVEAFAAAHPQHAERLRRVLPTMRVLLDLGNSAGKAEVAGEALGTLGDYRILREAGKGGMGVVYEAEQVSLGRRVALKVLPAATTLDGRQLQRFQNEARAAACLQHEHIVPVYGVGCERGVHFYAMQFIEGWTLEAVIRALRAGRPADGASLPTPPRPGEPTGDRTAVDGAAAPALGAAPAQPGPVGREHFRWAAEWGGQAAEALEHAHQLGIVHRDIKPANLMIDPRGKLWVTDFGLARIAAEPGLTVTGHLVGTLRYMSPEQAQARHGLVDHRADIYSLGVTLYELLTLRPAFDGQDPHELLRRVAAAEPPAPRRLNPAIPRDLETVVLRATARAPGQRYGTAQELADDLRRYLNGEPVRARRPTLAERASRWARRHRLLVAAAAAVLFVAALAAAVVAAVSLRAEQDTREALAREERHRITAEAHSRKAAANYAKARKAVDDMLSEVAEQWLADVPLMEPRRRKLLEKALAFYQDFLRENEESRELRRETCHAHKRLTDIYVTLGDHRAERACREALAFFTRLAAEDPEDPSYPRLQALTQMRLGLCLKIRGKAGPAEEAYRAALALQERLAVRYPKEPDHRRDLGLTLNNLGNLLRQSRASPEEVEKLHRRALAVQTRLADEFPTADHRQDLGATFHNLGVLLHESGRPQEALAAYRRAVELRKKLVADFPREADFRRSLAGDLTVLSNLLWERGRSPEAEKGLRRAVEISRKLVAEFPQPPQYRENLANACNSLGVVFKESKRFEEARAAYAEGVAVQEGLVRDFPRVPEHRNSLAVFHRNLGLLLADRGQHREAVTHFRQAIAANTWLVKASPGVAGPRENLAGDHANLADSLEALGEFAGAAASVRRALELAAELEKRAPDGARHQSQRATLLDALARLLQMQGQLGKARQALREALSLSEKLAAGSPGEPRRRDRLAHARGRLAWFLVTCPNANYRDAQEAVRLAREATRTSPQTGAHWGTLGLAHYRAGDWEAAVTALDRAWELKKGADAAECFSLAMSLWRQGKKGAARDWHRRGARWLEDNRQNLARTPGYAAILRQLQAEAEALLGPPDLPSEGKDGQPGGPAGVVGPSPADP